MVTGPLLLVILAVAIAFIVWSTARLKLHPFLALVIMVGMICAIPAAIAG